MKTFAGEHSEEYEAMKDALAKAAYDSGQIGEYAIYHYLDEIPQTSLVIELVNSLHKNGFEITARTHFSQM